MYQYRFLIILFMLISSCDGCDPLEELNNGNADPEQLIIELSGTDIATAINLQLNTFCDPPENFTADVEIEIRTGLIDQNMNISLNPDPYGGPSNTVDDEFDFKKDTGFNEGTKWTIMVPETGAYGIVMEIELQDCSDCCHGSSDLHCSDKRRYQESNKTWYCETGKPQMRVEELFTSMYRPAFDQNWEARDFLKMQKCRACSCEVICE